MRDDRGRAALQLAKHTTLYTLGIAVTRFANLLLLPLYLHTLSTQDYGVLGVLEQLVQLLVILAMAGGMEALVKIGSDLAGTPEQQLRLVRTMSTWVVVSGLTLGLIGALLWPWLGPLLGGIAFWPLALFALITVAGSAAFQALSAHLQVLGQVRAHTLYQALRTGLNVIFGVPLLLLTDLGVAALLVSASVSYWLAALALARRLRLGLRPMVDWRLLERTLSYGVPLLPHIGAAYIFQAIDKFMLAGSDQHGLEAAGVYSVGSRIASGAMMLGLGMQRAWLPYFFKEASENRVEGWQRVRCLSFWSMAGMASFVALLSLTSAELVDLIAPSGYEAAAGVTAVLCLSTLFRTGAQTAGAAVLSTPAAYRIWLASLPAALINVGLNAWWIPLWGVMGAAWATTVAMALNMVATAALARRVRPVPFRYLAITFVIVIASGLVVLARGLPLVARLVLCGAIPALAVTLDFGFAREQVRAILARK